MRAFSLETDPTELYMIFYNIGYLYNLHLDIKTSKYGIKSIIRSYKSINKIMSEANETIFNNWKGFIYTEA